MNPPRALEHRYDASGSAVSVRGTRLLCGVILPETNPLVLRTLDVYPGLLRSRQR